MVCHFPYQGLGNRVAQMFVKVMGKSTMGLAYGLAIAETAIRCGLSASELNVRTPAPSGLSKSRPI